MHRKERKMLRIDLEFRWGGWRMKLTVFIRR